MRPIDADALMQRIEKRDSQLRSFTHYTDRIALDVLCGVVEEIEDIDTLDYAPVRHARWIRQDDTYTRFQCGECKSKNFDRRWVFCPLCGAKMDGGKKDG